MKVLWNEFYFFKYAHEKVKDTRILTYFSYLNLEKRTKEFGFIDFLE